MNLTHTSHLQCASLCLHPCNLTVKSVACYRPIWRGQSERERNQACTYTCVQKSGFSHHFLPSFYYPYLNRTITIKHSLGAGGGFITTTTTTNFIITIPTTNTTTSTTNIVTVANNATIIFTFFLTALVLLYLHRF